MGRFSDDASGGRPSSESSDADEFIDDGGSIRWEDLTGTAVGAAVTLIAIAIADFLNLVSTGVVTFAMAVSSSMGDIVLAQYLAGESAVTSAFAETASFVPSLGIFAFPVAVGVVVLSVLLVLWGVTRFAR